MIARQMREGPVPNNTYVVDLSKDVCIGELMAEIIKNCWLTNVEESTREIRFDYGSEITLGWYRDNAEEEYECFISDRGNIVRAEWSDGYDLMGV